MLSSQRQSGMGEPGAFGPDSVLGEGHPAETVMYRCEESVKDVSVDQHYQWLCQMFHAGTSLMAQTVKNTPGIQET